MRTRGLVAALGALAGLASPSTARAEEPRCGNGLIEAGEACDLGIGNEVGRRCTARCAEPRCGDGELDVSEACDDGNLVDRDGCSAACIDEHVPRWIGTFDTGAAAGEAFAAVALTPEGPVAVGYAAREWNASAPAVAGFDHEGEPRFHDLLWSGPGLGTANAVAAISDDGGGVIVAGTVADLDGRLRPMVWRYEADGTRRYGVELELSAPVGTVTAVAPISADRALVAGIHDPFMGAETGWIGELDPRDGTLAWHVALEGGRRVVDMTLAPEGHLVAVGYLGNISPRIWIGAFELDGSPRWIHDQPPLNDGMPNQATSVAVAADGSIYATGQVAVGWVEESSGYDLDLWVGAFEADGTPRWSRVEAGAARQYDIGSDVVLDAEGRPLVVGTLQTQTLLTSSFWDRDAWLRQYDAAGETLWTWTYDGPLRNTDSGAAVALTDDGALVLVGDTSVRRRGQDGLVLELRPPALATGRRAPAPAPTPARPLALREQVSEPAQLDERGPHRATLQLEFDGGLLRQGDRGSLLEVPCVQSELGYPGFALDDQGVQAMTDRVAAVMAPYGVRVTTDDVELPPHLPRTTVLVGGLAEQIGLDAAAAGYACVVDCGDRWSWDLAFAFVRDVPSMANTVLHEAAHTWGLDHVVEQDLLMYPLGAVEDAGWGTGCVAVSDATSAPQCLEHHERWCPPGQQDSHAELLAAFGPAAIDVEPPRVEIVAPPTGQRLAPGQPLELELHVDDDDGDPGYRVRVPELEWERVVYDGETAMSLALPPGAFTVRVEAIDHAGNEAAAEIEVLVGEAEPPPLEPEDEGDGALDDDEPVSGRLDDGCSVGGRGVGAWTAALALLLLAPRRRRAPLRAR
jgi:cysteine-rich repeat protein